MRYLLILTIVSVLGSATAQNTFAGFGVTMATNFSSIIPLPGVQLGGFVSDTVVVRGYSSLLSWLRFWGSMCCTFHRCLIAMPGPMLVAV